MSAAATMSAMQEARDYLRRLAGRAVEPDAPSGMVWRCWGSGPDLLLLHGGYGSWRHWARVIEPLGSRYRLLVPDMPGFGDSPDAPADWTEDSLAATLVADMESLGIERLHAIAGFSFGGIIAGHVAAHLGDRIDHLLLIGPNGLGQPYNDIDDVRRPTKDMDEEEIAGVHRHNLLQIMLHRPESANDLAVAIQMDNAAAARARTTGIPESDSLFQVLPRITARLHGLWGEEDAFATGMVDGRETLLRSFQSDLRFHRLPATGHWVPFEAPEETVRTVLGLADPV